MIEPLTSENPKRKWSWKGFWQRFKLKRLDGSDHEGLFLRIVIPVGLLSMVALILIDIECSADDWMKYFTVIYIWPPLTILGWLVAYRTLAWQKNWWERFWLVITPILLGWLGRYIAVGYIILTNAILEEEGPVYVSGRVIEQQKGQTRFTGFNYYLTVRYEERHVCLNVNQTDYLAHPVGTTYGREMRKGRYGYFYQWHPGAIWK